MSYRYHTNDVVLVIPAGFKDRSSTILEWDGAPGQPIHLVATRADKPTLDVTKLLEDASREVEVSFHGATRVEPLALTTSFEVAQTAFRFRKDDRVYFQRLLFIAAEGYVLSISTLGPASMRAAVDELTQNAIQNLMFRAND
jgi:hypothetical protein